MSAVRQDGADVLIFVRAKPRASKSRLLTQVEGELQVALAAPPVDGAANVELLKFLAGMLGVPRSRLSLERGESSRHKVVRVTGLPLAAALSSLLP
jgi:uncharacterized protein (TIGR00251 family)